MNSKEEVLAEFSKHTYADDVGASRISGECARAFLSVVLDERDELAKALSARRTDVERLTKELEVSDMRIMAFEAGIEIVE